uniref:Secreted protein n=1 Tax=Heterorhabditis bacteriophora TaxID=37862 RepID=A0A1I7WYJ4_HETBA
MPCSVNRLRLAPARTATSAAVAHKTANAHRWLNDGQSGAFFRNRIQITTPGTVTVLRFYLFHNLTCTLEA